MFVDRRRESEMAADSTVEQMRNMKKYLKLCEVLLIGAVLLVIVGVLLLPIVFYVIKKAAQHVSAI